MFPECNRHVTGARPGPPHIPPIFLFLNLKYLTTHSQKCYNREKEVIPLKKKYSLDFSIVRDIDRMHAVEEILDTMSTDPSATELEQMASYILYGKDENGQNSIQRNETIDKDKRYKSYKTKDDKV